MRRAVWVRIMSDWYPEYPWCCPNCLSLLRRAGACDCQDKPKPDTTAAALRQPEDDEQSRILQAGAKLQRESEERLIESRKPRQPEAQPTEAQVAAGAEVLADSPSIDGPKLPAPCWMGLSRAVLTAAKLAAQPAEDEAKK